MTDVINSAVELNHQLDDDLSKARESLRSIDEGIKSLTGRSAVEFTRFNRGGGRGAGPAGRMFQQNRTESFDDSRGSGGFAGSKRRISTLGTGRGEDEGDAGWKRPRLSYDFQDTSNYAYQNDPFDDDSVRGPKPTIASSVTVTQKELKSRDEAIAELKTTEKRDVAVRNRRMFGVLLGTLQKFKKDEDTKSYKEQEKRQKEIECKIEEAKRKDHIDLQKQKEKLLEQRRRQQAELRRLQRKKALIAATENQMAQLRRLQNFIQTNSKPPIFYMPLKHTIRTIELQKKSQKRLEEMVKRKQEEMEQELKSIDELVANLDSDDDEQTTRDAQGGGGNKVADDISPSNGDKIKTETSSDTVTEGVDDAQVQPSVVEPKTIQDELNELANAATNYELHFEEDEPQEAL